MTSRIFYVTLFFSLLGVALSTYSLLHHYSFVPGTFCDLSATFNCDTVNRGPFSELYGVPVSLLGVIGYAFMALTAVLRKKNPTDATLRMFAMLLALGGMGFALYLTGIEAFVLRTWCIVCLTSQASMLTILIATILSLRKRTFNNV